MQLAPDLCAPGARIYAAGYGDSGDPRLGFGESSGTSMACPHVAGAAALVLAKHPEFTPSEVHSALMSTANYKDILDFDGTPAQPLTIGAGRIDLEKAIDPALYLNPPSLSFSVIPNDKSVSMKFKVKNYRDAPMTLSIKAVHHTDKGAVEDAPSWVSVEPATAVVPSASSSETVTITVTINASQGEIGDEQGYIVLEDSATNEEVAHLPYWARIVYKESDRVDVYLVDFDMSECGEGENYLDRYTAVLDAEKVSYKVFDICSDDFSTEYNEINYLKARSVIFFTGDYPSIYIAEANNLIREVLHSKVPVILMGASMSYSWEDYGGQYPTVELPSEFGVAFHDTEVDIATVKPGKYAPWTMSSFKATTNVETRPLSDETLGVVLEDDKGYVNKNR